MADYRCTDFAAAYNRQHIIDMWNVQVCEIVQDEAHGNGEPVLGVVAIGAAAKAGKSLFDEEAGKSLEAVIYVVDGTNRARFSRPNELKSMRLGLA